eukprot:5930139-Amphidinium_carterae.1
MMRLRPSADCKKLRSNTAKNEREPQINPNGPNHSSSAQWSLTAANPDHDEFKHSRSLCNDLSLDFPRSCAALHNPCI